MNGRNLTCERRITKELFRVLLTRETYTGKKKPRTSKHIRAAINFLDVALERETGRALIIALKFCLQKASKKLTLPPFLLKHNRAKGGLAA